MTEFTIQKSPIERELISKVEPVIVNLGYALRDLEVTPGSGSTVRITLEPAPSTAEAIGIDDCQKVHQLLGPMFDVWDPLPGAYTLEVSSPGESPSLRTLAHFQQSVGGLVELQTTEPIPMPPPAKPRKNWESKLVSVSESDGSLQLEDSMGTHTLKISQIKSGSWIRDWARKNEKPGKQKGQKSGSQKPGQNSGKKRK